MCVGLRVGFRRSPVRPEERGRKRRLRLVEPLPGRFGPLERRSGQWSVRESRGSESVLGTFVLDSPSKVPFTSVLMAQLYVSRSGARQSSGNPPVSSASGRKPVGLGFGAERSRRGRGAARKGVACTAWARMPPAGRDCAEKSGRASKKSAAQSALPAGAFGGMSWGSESVLGTFVLDSPSKVLFSSFWGPIGASAASALRSRSHQIAPSSGKP